MRRWSSVCAPLAIPIGRTNLPDMALRIHTASSLHGLTRNPWHPGRTAGGSSGGEAAALASGMSPIGLGNDIGGSLRNPANACGIASIRPSAGRVPEAGYVPAEDRLLAVELMNVQGPMARRVADVRLGLRILIGAHPRDPWSIDAPFDGPADPRGGAGRAARGQHRSKSGGDRATCSACAGRRRLCRGRNLPAPLRAVAARVVFGASSFNFSKASGIMRPNIELSMAVGMRPPEFSAPCAPDIRNCGTSG
jgi:hypothetical protein